MVGKVTALIVRGHGAQAELLLFRHPNAGIQIPAGTIEPGETPRQAVQREAFEETGLSAFSDIRLLGVCDEMLPARLRMVADSTQVYTRPDAGVTYGLTLRTGIVVHLERERGEYAQVSYQEWDRTAPTPYISYRITGWVPRSVLATGKRRSIFLMRFDDVTPATWQITTEGHCFSLFWAPIQSPPAIVRSQSAWLDYLPRDLARRKP